MFIIGCLMGSLLSLAIGDQIVAQIKRNNLFDLLVFSQHWPYTTCLVWEEKQHGGCRQINEDIWTVHGLWPTRLHKKDLSFCNTSWPFEVSNLEPIISRMERYWPDFELKDDQNYLYDLEWMKHGTCVVAAKVPGISTQQDYFKAGCRMAKENPIATWLKEWDIVPSDTFRYTMESVWNAVVAGAGTRPRIDCDKVDGEVYIKEIKVCYDNSLARIDCDVEDKMVGTCLRYRDFLYPNSIHSSYFTTTTDLPETTTSAKTTSTTSSSKTTGSNSTKTSPTTSGNSTKTSSSPEKSTERPNPRSGPSTGFIAGIVCGVLALIAVGLGIGLFVYKRRNGRSGYESL